MNDLEVDFVIFFEDTKTWILEPFMSKIALLHATLRGYLLKSRLSCKSLGTFGGSILSLSWWFQP